MLHWKTPLLHSVPLSEKLDRPVYLKLDNLQIPGSFKIRGIGHTCAQAKQDGYKQIVGSSGGNAGMAMAYAGQQLGMPTTLFIPRSTPKMMINLMEKFKAEVIVAGENWNEANDTALKYLEENPGAKFVHPFDQESTWEGHSSIVAEVKEDLRRIGVEIPPKSLVTCVGGGGLAVGILLGMEKAGWKSTTDLITMETFGADCFSQSLANGEIVTLPAITSIAKSLGALSVTPKLLEMATNGGFQVKSGVVTDKEALQSCLNFSTDHRMLVEPACGAVLASAYFKKELFDTADGDKKSPIVIVVCGGNMATIELFEMWKNQVGL